jgi:hypothetical protein
MNLEDTLEKRFLESGMHAMQRRSGGMKCTPDLFVITSLDVVIYHDRKLGEGGFGQVYQGDWQGTTVAVKVLERGTPPFVSFLPIRFIVINIDRMVVLDVSKGDRRMEETSTSEYIRILWCLFDCRTTFLSMCI